MYIHTARTRQFSASGKEEKVKWLYLRASPAARDSSKIEPIPVGSRRSEWPHRSFLVSMVLPARGYLCTFPRFCVNSDMSLYDG